jgi:hypothetical protein
VILAGIFQNLKVTGILKKNKGSSKYAKETCLSEGVAISSYPFEGKGTQRECLA